MQYRPRILKKVFDKQISMLKMLKQVLFMGKLVSFQGIRDVFMTGGTRELIHAANRPEQTTM